MFCPARQCKQTIIAPCGHHSKYDATLLQQQPKSPPCHRAAAMKRPLRRQWAPARANCSRSCPSASERQARALTSECLSSVPAISAAIRRARARHSFRQVIELSGAAATERRENVSASLLDEGAFWAQLVCKNPLRLQPNTRSTLQRRPLPPRAAPGRVRSALGHPGTVDDPTGASALRAARNF